MDAAKTYIVESIQQNPVMVFGKVRCPYCIATSERLDQLGATYKYDQLDAPKRKGPEGSAIQDVLDSEDLFGTQAEVKKQYGLTIKKYQRTVPSIWIGQEQIGGCDDFMSIPDDEVKEKLRSAGALTEVKASL